MDVTEAWYQHHKIADDSTTFNNKVHYYSLHQTVYINVIFLIWQAENGTVKIFDVRCGQHFELLFSLSFRWEFLFKEEQCFQAPSAKQNWTWNKPTIPLNFFSLPCAYHKTEQVESMIEHENWTVLLKQAFMTGPSKSLAKQLFN